MRKSKALTAILRHSDQVLSTPDTDPAYPFLHTVVNYARAKQESEGALARVAELISIETQKPVNEAQIKPRFLSLVKWRDPADWTGLNCSSASFWLVFSARVSWLFYQWKVDNKPESRLIHNRPGPVRCENAWYRSVTSQQCAGPEKGDCG